MGRVLNPEECDSMSENGMFQERAPGFEYFSKAFMVLAEFANKLEKEAATSGANSAAAGHPHDRPRS
jgi:hypothetical protein